MIESASRSALKIHPRARLGGAVEQSGARRALNAPIMIEKKTKDQGKILTILNLFEFYKKENGARFEKRFLIKKKSKKKKKNWNCEKEILNRQRKINGKGPEKKLLFRFQG